jgi:inner membrane protein
MRAITHISFGLLTLGLVSSFTKLPLSLEIIITTSLSSLLPDIDTTKSTIGKVLKPISSFLDTKFGHRTITHSLLACIFLAIISLPLLFLKTNYYQALQIGYFSHLMIDCINKTGIPFFYPNNTFFVFPSSPKWRIEVGSVAEYILCGLIIFATFGIWYLNGIGFRSWLSSLLASPELAVKEYRSHANKYKMSVKVKGFYILSPNYGTKLLKKK